jgi:16S rRNA (adenine1518-N6/adenine1519-N6)-dimethyltransferase
VVIFENGAEWGVVVDCGCQTHEFAVERQYRAAVLHLPMINAKQSLLDIKVVFMLFNFWIPTMPDTIYSRNATRNLLSSLGHFPRKGLGQNFLYSQPTIDRLVASLLPLEGEKVFEIGPGLGHLTFALLAEGACITAVELDRTLAANLSEQVSLFGELKVVCEDALNISLEVLYSGEEKIVVVGNLPYYISSKIIFHLLAQAHRIDRMGFMLQEEVGLRMIAPPGSKDYGRLSVVCQYWGEPKLVVRVSPRNFYPAPKVGSAFMIWKPERPRIAKSEAVFSALVERAFAQRRKMLKGMPTGTLAGMEFNRDILLEACKQADIDPTRRAETLAVDEFLNLADVLSK